MAEADANIKFTADTAQALASIKDLQRNISTLYTSMNKGAASAQAAQAGMQQNLVNSINSSGKFTARLTTIRTTTESFTNSLEKNKLSLGQYFRFGVASSKNFSKVFTTEFNTIDKVARERVKDLQTQYVKMGRDANGAMKAISVRPTTLDMTNLGTQTAITAQKQQIFNQLLKQGTTNLLNFGKNTQWAGRQLMVGFTIPLTIFATQAARAFQNLEKQVIQFRRVYGDLLTTPQETEAALKEVRELALEFTKLGVSVEDTLELAAKVAQMGNVGADLIGQVTEATRLSVLGAMDQQDALDTTVGLTNAFGVSIEDLTTKVDFLNAAENQTILAMSDFNQAVPRAGSVVRQLGGEVEDLAFFMTAMREGGIEATQAANALKSSLGRLINPSEAARNSLRSMGIDITSIVERNAGDLKQTIIELAFALDTLPDLQKTQQLQQLFGTFQYARMSAMMQNIVQEGSQANRVLELMTLSTEELASISSRELGRVEESAATKFTSALEKFRTELAPIGEEFLKMVTPILEWATSMIAGFNKIGDGGRAFIVGLLGVIGGLAPVLLMVIGLVANLIANIAKGIGLTFRFFQKLAGGSKNLAEQTTFLNSEQIASETVAASLNQTHQTLEQTYTGEAGSLDVLAEAYRRATAEMEAFHGPIRTGPSSMVGFPGIPTAAGSVPGFAKGRRAPGYKDGIVEVPGPKGAGDIIPAMLAPGEAVIPADMSKRYAALINAMIAGNIPGFMAGRNAPDPKTNEQRIGAIAASAPQRSQANVTQHLEGQVAAILERADQTVVDRFLAFAENVATRTVDGIRAELSRQENQQLEFDMKGGASGQPAFAHVGGPAAMPVGVANRNRDNLGLTDSAINPLIQIDQKQLDDAANRLGGEVSNYQEQVVRLYHGLGFSISKFINELMSKNGADVQIMLQDLEGRAEDLRGIYGTAVAHGGGDLNELSRNQVDDEGQEIASSSALAKFHQALQENLQRLHTEAGEGVKLLVVDTREILEDQRRKIELAGGTFDESQYVVFEEVVSSSIEEVGGELQSVFAKAKDKLTELRASLNTEAQGVKAELANRAVGPGDRTHKTSLNQPGGFPIAQELAEVEAAAINAANNIVERGGEAFGNAFNEAAAAEGQTASPSKVSGEIGANHSRGFTEGAETGVAEAEQAGKELAGAVVAGASTGRGGKGRVRTAGPTTPGKEIDFEILNGKVVEAAVVTESFGQKTAGAATKLVGLGSKIGMAGIGFSSLIGILGRVEGPVGDFANKLFPIISTLTGLSFALRMVNAEMIASLGARIDESIAVARSSQAKKVLAGQDLLRAKISKINIVAKQKEAAASANLTRAKTAQTVATHAATRGLTAMTTASMFAGGGALGRVGGNVAGGAVATGSKAAAAISNQLITAQTRLLRMTVTLSKSFSTFGARFIRFFGRLGVGILAVAKGVAAFLGPVGLVVAGLALVGIGIFSLIKAIKRNQDKINGLGDAAALSGKKLEVLNSVLGGNLALAKIGGVGGIGAAATGVGGLGEEEAASARSIQADLLKSKEFKKEYQGIIDGLEGASVEAAERSLTSMALTLQSAGASDEMIAGIINALLESAGKTDVVLEFGSITIGEVAESAQDAVDEYLEGANVVAAPNFDNTTPVDAVGLSAGGSMPLTDDQLADAGRQFEEHGSLAPEGLVVDDAEKRAAAAGLLASAVTNASLAFTKGEITAEEYAEAIGSVNGAIESAGEQNSSLAGILMRDTIERLKESVDLDSVMDEINSFMDQGDVASAGLILEATALGIEIDEEELQSLKDAEEGAADAIRKRMAAKVDADNLETKMGEQDVSSQEFVTKLNDENTAMQSQIDTFGAVSKEIENNNDILDKAAFARKVASDEALREEFNLAQSVDAYNENSDAVDSFVEALVHRSAMEAELENQQARLDIDEQIRKHKEQEVVTEGLALALGDAAEAEGIMNNALAQSLILSHLASEGFDTAAMSAEELGKAIEESDILTVIAAMKEGGGFDFTPPSRSSGGSQGPDGSFLDDITKRIKLFGNAQASVTKGFEASMQAILDFADVAGTLGGEFNGLNKQLRGLGLNENLIEMITGMDPDEYEKRKNDLFIFDDQGTIIGMTTKLEGLNAALNTVVVGEFINTQKDLANSISNQVVAIDKLTAAGASYEAAYRSVQDTAFAAAVATAASAAEIQKAADAVMEAQRQMDRMSKINEEEQRQKGISDAVKQMNKDFATQGKILNFINKNRKTLRESQIEEILNDKNLQALVLEPSINPGALSEALANAEKRADLELKIKKLTLEGQQEIFEEGLGRAMDAFNARSQKIEFDFEANIKNERDIIKQAEEEIALLNFELQTYEDELKDIEFQEDEINKAYEKRFEALDRIAEANAEISRQQQAQLDVADALSRGDIAGAARAVREARQASGEAAREQEQKNLERAQQGQLLALTSRGGLGREELEERTLEIEKQIFEIERSKLNPAQELVRLAELKKDAEVESLEILGKTREEYEKISNRIEVARAGNWKNVEAIQESLDLVEKIVASLEKAKPLPPAPDPPAPPPVREPAGAAVIVVPTNPVWSQWRESLGLTVTEAEARGGGPARRLSGGGMIVPKRMAGGGPAFPVKRMAVGSVVKKYPVGGLIPYSSVGGPFPSLGSDTIPAMLTPGEFVIRRPAVREIGVDNLENLNRNASMGGDVYNYSVSVNVKSESNPDRIARTVIDQMKRIDSQRIRGNRY